MNSNNNCVLLQIFERFAEIATSSNAMGGEVDEASADNSPPLSEGDDSDDDDEEEGDEVEVDTGSAAGEDDGDSGVGGDSGGGGSALLNVPLAESELIKT
jgi:hypothetical protein